MEEQRGWNGRMDAPCTHCATRHSYQLFGLTFGGLSPPPTMAAQDPTLPPAHTTVLNLLPDLHHPPAI